MTIPDEVDIIVVGGGSCGCVVAGRLANLDHNLQVMLIEAGESNLNVSVMKVVKQINGLHARRTHGCTVPVSIPGT